MKHDPASLPPFVRWYIEAAGEFKAPPVFHFWSALALLSAYAAKRYWIEIVRGSPLHPNLYIGLIGTSASGKGLSIRNAVNLIRPELVNEGDTATLDWPYLYQGRITAQALVDHLTRVAKHLDPDLQQPAEFFLVCPELGQSLDMPPNMVSGFIRMMTGAYDDTGAPWSDSTRMYGFKHAPQAYLSWLFGTTAEWFHDAVKDIDYKGGFAGRVLTILCETREPFRNRPSYSARHDDLQAYLRTHLMAVRCGGGAFTMSTDAEDADEMWCRQRYESPPIDDRMEPFTARGDTLVKKLAMLFALARCVTRRVITLDDIICAQRAIAAVESDLPRVLELIFTTAATRLAEAFKQLVREHGRIERAIVMRHLMRQFGVTRKDFLEAEATLLVGKFIQLAGDDYLWMT